MLCILNKNQSLELVFWHFLTHFYEIFETNRTVFTPVFFAAK